MRIQNSKHLFEYKQSVDIDGIVIDIVNFWNFNGNIMNNHYMKLREIFSSGDFDLNKKLFKDEQTILHVATSAANLSLIQLLSEFSVDWNVRNKFEETALMLACQDDSVALVKLLTEQSGCFINITGKFHSTPLEIACRNSNLNVVEYLINLPDIDIHNNSYLCILLDNCNDSSKYISLLSIITKLVSMNIDVNAVYDSCEQTAIYYAVNNKILPVIEYLVGLKTVKLDLIDENENSVFDYVLSIPFICKYFIDWVIKYRNIDIIINYKNKETMLTDCIIYRELDLVKYLIEQNANLNHVNSSGLSIFELLLDSYDSLNKSLIMLFLKKIGDIDWQDHKGNSLLMIAVKCENFEIVKYLIKKGCDLSIRNKKGEDVFKLSLSSSTEIYDYLRNL